MFTGIIETTGIIEEVVPNGNNKTYWVRSSISAELTIDQSLAHDGACLTIEETKDGRHRVTAIEETLSKTCLDSWETGYEVNLERCLLVNSRLDGHFVQGHVDTTGLCREIRDRNGSREIRIEYPAEFAALIIEKGSVCVNGISLTVFNIDNKAFTIAVIPHTLKMTNIKSLQEGMKVNLEFDLLGKHIARFLNLKQFVTK